MGSGSSGCNKSEGFLVVRDGLVGFLRLSHCFECFANGRTTKGPFPGSSHGVYVVNIPSLKLSRLENQSSVRHL